jgi:L-ascorbate metabolism protein UlaG (beta-lactamase superfamily)
MKKMLNRPIVWSGRLSLGLAGAGTLLALVGTLAAQEARFTGVERLTNREMRLTFSAPTGFNYRIDVSTNLTSWVSMVSFPIGAGTRLQTDSGVPFLPQCFYRAEQLTNSGLLTGDHLATTNGDAVIHPGNHAGFALSWNGHAIYVDPVTNVFQGLPAADLILITHDHGDHLNQTTLNAVKAANARIIAPQAVYTALSPSLKSITTVLTNGMSTNLLGARVEAFPMYNLGASPYHPRYKGNGYLLTLADKRVYISGDTDNTPELLELNNIDVAFVCMRPPYSMSMSVAASAVRSFQPRVVYPYHYLGNDTAVFKQLVGADLGIEVRLRPWY